MEVLNSAAVCPSYTPIVQITYLANGVATTETVFEQARVAASEEECAGILAALQKEFVVVVRKNRLPNNERRLVPRDYFPLRLPELFTLTALASALNAGGVLPLRTPWVAKAGFLVRNNPHQCFSIRAGANGVVVRRHDPVTRQMVAEAEPIIRPSIACIAAIIASLRDEGR